MNYESRIMQWVLKFASYKHPDDIFDAVVEGKKTIETRPINPESSKDYSKIKKGDKLVLYSLDSGRKIEKSVTFVHVYKSVKQMVENEPIEKIFPGVSKPEELELIFEEFKKKWGSSYANKLEKHGIVAIGMD